MTKVNEIKYWIINMETKQFFPVDAESAKTFFDGDWKEKTPFKDERYINLSVQKIWGDQKASNYLFYNYDLCVSGMIAGVYADMNHVAEDEVQQYARKLRNDQDVVSLVVHRLVEVQSAPATVNQGKISVGTNVTVGEPKFADSPHASEFEGTVVGYKDNLVQIEDQEGNVYDIDPREIEVTESEDLIAKVNRDEFRDFVLDHIEHFNAIPTEFEDSNGCVLWRDECWELASTLALTEHLRDDEGPSPR